MTTNKYANLPDIDTAPDIYETDDAVPTYAGIGNSSEDESSLAPRSSATNIRSKSIKMAEGVDSSGLIGSNEATKKFRKAERKSEQRDCLVFSRAEDEDSETDAGELIHGLVDVRHRLENVKKSREGREKLIGLIFGQGKELEERKEPKKTLGNEEPTGRGRQKLVVKADEAKYSIVDLDCRVGELEDLIGSSRIALDEASPLPAPLLPMLNRLNTQITLLTQPRHLDSISRRLKLLISDLDRLSTTHNAQSGGRRQTQPQQPTASANAPSALQEQILPLLARLAPHLPHLPHLLARMRTLSALHASAADTQSVLSALEEEQFRTHGRLDVLAKAVEGVEKSLDENAQVVRGNVSGLEERIGNLIKRLDALS